MTGACPREVALVVVDEVLVPLFQVVVGIYRAAEVVAVLGKEGAHAHAEVHAPMLAPASLVAYVHVGVEVLASFFLFYKKFNYGKLGLMIPNRLTIKFASPTCQMRVCDKNYIHVY